MKLGLDLGKSKIEAAVINNDGVVVWQDNKDANTINYDDFLNSIIELVKSAQSSENIEAMGIGIPGYINPDGKTIEKSKLSLLNKHPFTDDLKSATGLEIKLANKAHCTTLAEALNGVAKDYHNVFCLRLGSECSSGLTVNKQIILGRHGISGDIGHMPLPWPLHFEYDDHECPCGKTGCINTYLSGPAISKDYESRTGDILSVKEIAERTQIDLVAESVLQVFEERLARVLGQIIILFDPDAIVLGGGIAHLDRLYQNLPSKWKSLMPLKTIQTPVLKSQYGDDSVLHGAVRLWADDLH